MPLRPTHKPRPALNALAATVAMLAAATPAHALLVEDSFLSSGHVAAGISGQHNYSESSNTIANGSFSASDQTGSISNYAAANSFATDRGVYGAIVEMSGPASGEANLLLRRTVTNDDVFAQAINFDLFLFGGDLQVNSPGGTAGYDWDISYTSTAGTFDIFSSAVSIDGIGVTEANGLGAGTGIAYSWGNQQLNDIALGVLGTGESLTIEYALTTFATSLAEGPTVPCEDADGAVDFHCPVASRAFTGVEFPQIFSSLPFGNSDRISGSVVLAPVDEPGVLALLGVAGVALVVTAGKRSKAA